MMFPWQLLEGPPVKLSGPFFSVIKAQSAATATAKSAFTEKCLAKLSPDQPTSKRQPQQTIQLLRYLN